MGLKYMGVPKDLLIFLKAASDAKSFVETGTFRGGTTKMASKLFDNVWTIEAQEAIYRQTKDANKSLANVEFLLGHSRRKLPGIIVQITAPAIFWLDAHWSGGETWGETDECPVLDEIRAIDCSDQQHIILIDDARLFLMPPPLPHKAEHWPPITEIVDVSREVYADAFVVVVDDVIVRTPAHLKLAFTEWLQCRPSTMENDGETPSKKAFSKIFNRKYS